MSKKKKTKKAPAKETPVYKVVEEKDFTTSTMLRIHFSRYFKLIKLPIFKSFMEFTSFTKDLFNIRVPFRISYHNTTSNTHTSINNWEDFQTAFDNNKKLHSLQVSTLYKKGFPFLNFNTELHRESNGDTSVAHKPTSTLPKEPVQNQLSIEELKKATVPPLTQSNQNLQLLKSPKETIPPLFQKEPNKTTSPTSGTKQLQKKSTHPISEEPTQPPSKKSKKDKPTKQPPATNLSSVQLSSNKPHTPSYSRSNFDTGTSNKGTKQATKPYNLKTSLPTPQETPNSLSSSTHSARKNSSRSLTQVSIPKSNEHSSTRRNTPSTNNYHSNSTSSTTESTASSATSSASSSSSDTNREQSSSATPHPSPSRTPIPELHGLPTNQPSHFPFEEPHQPPYNQFPHHSLPSVYQDPHYMRFSARQHVEFHQGFPHQPYSNPYNPHPFPLTMEPYRDPAQLLSYFDNGETMNNIAPSVHNFSSMPPNYSNCNGEASFPYLNHPTVTLPVYSLPPHEPPTLSEPTQVTASAEHVKLPVNKPSEVFTGSVKLSAGKPTGAIKEPNRLPVRAPSTDQYNKKGSSVLAIVEKYQDALSNHSTLDILSELLLDQILDGAQVNLTLLERSLQRFKIISQSSTTINNNRQPDPTPPSRQHDILDLTED